MVLMAYAESSEDVTQWSMEVWIICPSRPEQGDKIPEEYDDKTLRGSRCSKADA